MKKETRGGNHGGGRPKSENPKQNKNFRLSSDLIKFIESLPKGQGIIFVEEALRFWIERYNRKNIESYPKRGVKQNLSK